MTKIIRGERISVFFLRHPHIRPPRGWNTSVRYLGFDDRQNYTEETWAALPWHVPEEFLNGRDPKEAEFQFDPKPSFDTIYQWLRAEKLRGFSYRDSGLALNARVNRVATAPADHPDFKSPLHVGGGGIDRMTALINMIDNAANAGEDWPTAILRHVNADHGEARFWTPGQAQQFIGPISKAKNRAESASTICSVHLAKIEAKMRDETGGLDETATDQERIDERFKSLEAYEKYIEDLDTHFAAALKQVDREATELPKDLTLAQRRLTGWLEGAATARMKAIKFAEGQQGIDLHAACDDEGIAHTEIAAEKKIGQIRIERADTVEKAKAAYDKAVIAINGVKARRTPVFHKFTTATNSERIHGDSVTYKETSVKIRAQHPNWRESRLAIPGEVSMFGHVETDAEGNLPEGAFLDFSTPETPSELGEMDVTLHAKAGVRTEYRLTGRSICGPSLLTVILDPPAKETPAS